MTPAQPTHSLAAWLLDHARETPPESVLRATNLAAYAYAALPPEHPARPALRADYLAALSRHERIKRELISIVTRWNAAGIEPLLFKGFYLAEFVYPAPGMRFHGDADLVVKPEQATVASEIAQSAGWTEEDNNALMGQPYKHSVCSLYGPEGAACVDLHRLVLHCELPWDRVQRRVTEAVWARSEPLEWEGVRIRVPAPVDAALVGLVLQRCWGDRWHLKPHDVLDLRFLSERLGVTRDALLHRASEMGVERTLAIFLGRCDPAAARLELRPVTRIERLRSDHAVMAERGLLNTYAWLLRRTRNLPRAVVGLGLALPSLAAAHRALGRERNIETLLHSLAPRATGLRSTPVRRDRVVRGVLRGARIFPRNPEGDCVLRSLAICHALWREGWPAHFVSGVRREAGELRGHAWVELDGRVIAALCEATNRERYAVQLDYPSPAERAAAG